MNFRLLTTILIGTAPFVVGAIPAVTHSSEAPLTAHCWDVVDIAFPVGKAPDQPVDVDFTATFQAPASEPLQVASFYDGDNKYLLRP